jgi:hypothetical protein
LGASFFFPCADAEPGIAQTARVIATQHAARRIIFFSLSSSL